MKKQIAFNGHFGRPVTVSSFSMLEDRDSKWVTGNGTPKFKDLGEFFFVHFADKATVQRLHSEGSASGDWKAWDIAVQNFMDDGGVFPDIDELDKLKEAFEFAADCMLSPFKSRVSVEPPAGGADLGEGKQETSQIGESPLLPPLPL